ncbi:hypothetical protein K490DRAFT_65579 [Saccharata proteae CBS 121410]|uniref:Uncharacterized protein n=1 Tax=Saccharata proteae CBS 121410 TaxID=1314787 RepID=A0A9P4HYU8_9PEZI|nr:hypothetical protein K490DRAFT_65579 [Saccharata proteae CBS 121410]
MDQNDRGYPAVMPSHLSWLPDDLAQALSRHWWSLPLVLQRAIFASMPHPGPVQRGFPTIRTIFDGRLERLRSLIVAREASRANVHLYDLRQQCVEAAQAWMHDPRRSPSYFHVYQVYNPISPKLIKLIQVLHKNGFNSFLEYIDIATRPPGTYDAHHPPPVAFMQYRAQISPEDQAPQPFERHLRFQAYISLLRGARDPTALPSTAQQSTAQQSTAQQSTAQQSTAQQTTAEGTASPYRDISSVIGISETERQAWQLTRARMLLERALVFPAGENSGQSGNLGESAHTDSNPENSENLTEPGHSDSNPEHDKTNPEYNDSDPEHQHSGFEHHDSNPEAYGDL